MTGTVKHTASCWVIESSTHPHSIAIHPNEKNDLLTWLTLENKEVDFFIQDGMAKISSAKTWPELIRQIQRKYNVTTSSEILRVLEENFAPPIEKNNE